MSKNSSKISNNPFLAQTCPKMDFTVGISKIWLQIWNQIFQDTIGVNFQAKRTILTFLDQGCPKMNFGVRILKI